MSTINIDCLIDNVGNAVTTVEELKCCILAGGINDAYHHFYLWLVDYTYYKNELDRLYEESDDWAEIENYQNICTSIENDCMAFMDTYTYPEIDNISLVGECNGCLSYICPLNCMNDGLFSNINVKTIDLSGITDLQNMRDFRGLCRNSLVEKVIFPTSNIVNAYGLPFELAEWSWAFQGCENLTTLQNFTNFKCRVMNGKEIFNGCKSLKKLDLSSIDNFKEIQNINFDGLTSLEELVLPKSVENPLTLPKGHGSWFLTDKNNNALAGTPVLKVTNTLINTESAAKVMIDVNGQVKNLNMDSWLKLYYFTVDEDNNMIWLRHYAADTTATSINIPQTAQFNGKSYEIGILYYDLTHSMSNMSYMWPSTVTSINFEGEIIFQSSSKNDKVFKTMTKLKTINHENLIFKGDCSNLFKQLNLVNDSFIAKINSKSKITSGASMFANCSNIIAPDLSKLNISSMTNLSSMFSGCSKLQSIDLSNWNFSAVTDMSYMFQNCSKLKTVNFGKINTSSLTYTNSMFYNCPLLETITSASFDTSKITTSLTATIFYNCPLLKGAIAFDNNKKGWDMLNSNTGYFTWISNMFIIRKGTVAGKAKRIANSNGESNQ